MKGRDRKELIRTIAYSIEITSLIEITAWRIIWQI